MVQQLTSAGNMRNRCLHHMLFTVSNLKKLWIASVSPSVTVCTTAGKTFCQDM
jgi:hypothetical protein